MKINFSKIVLICLIVICWPLLVCQGQEILTEGGFLLEESLPGTQELLKEPEMPGRIEGAGTSFEVKNSEYLNVILKSDEAIEVSLESIPRMISLDIKSASSGQVNLVLAGLESNKTYYKYEDSYKNGAVFISSENGDYVWVQDLSQRHHIWFQEERGTTFIDSDTTLDNDIIGSIEITVDNVTLDCNNYRIGGDSGYGIYLNKKKGVSVKNCKITRYWGRPYPLFGFSYAIYLYNSSYNTISNNIVTNNWGGIYFTNSSNDNLLDNNNVVSSRYTGITLSVSNNNILAENIILNSDPRGLSAGIDGIHLNKSNNNTFTSNTISNNSFGVFVYNSQNNIFTNNTISLNRGGGVYLYDSDGNTFSGNAMSDNGYLSNYTSYYNFGVVGRFNNSIDITNTVDGKPIYYILNAENKIYDSSTNAGTFYCVNCNNIIVKDLTLTKNLYGIFFLNTHNSKIENTIVLNNVSGIYLKSSSNNTLINNAANSNEISGITFYNSNNNNLINNTTNLNKWAGIYLSVSNNNNLTGNTMGGNRYNFGIEGYDLDSYSSHNIDISNTVDGKPIYYIKNGTDQVYGSSTNAGIFYCFFCDNVTIKNLTLTNNVYGIFFWGTQNSKVENVTTSNNLYYGITWQYSSNNILLGNTVSNNWRGIYILKSANNTLINNSVLNNNYDGIRVGSSDYNIIIGNTINSNSASSNIGAGIYISDSNYNKIYHNNFIKNIPQVDFLTGANNLFDNDYPSGGNYWSDYTGMDLYSGENQDVPSSDGIGDTPYTFTGGQDKYPFMKEGDWVPPPLPENQPPAADFNWWPEKPTFDEEILFDASSSTDPDGQIVSYHWDFGNGSGAEEKIATTTYQNTGDYNVILTITDNAGATSSISKTITVMQWSFAIITDLHIGRGYSDYDGATYDDNGAGEDYYLTERLANVVNWINRNKNNINCGETMCPIKFLAVLGDITNTAEKSQFLKAKSILDKLNDPNSDGDAKDGIPYVPVFGNHDVWPYTDLGEAASSSGEEYFDEILWDENATNTKLLRQRLNFQRDKINTKYKNFSLSHKDMNFIGLDFASREILPPPLKGVMPNAVFSSTTKNWLEGELNKNGGSSTILLSHHPLFEDSIMGFSFGPWPLPDELNEIKNIIEGKNVLTSFSGHIHGFYDWWRKEWRDANEEKYSPVGTTPVITTETLMMGSNQTDDYLKEHDKGIIKIVKILGTNGIDYNTNEGKYKPETGEGKEFVALNPHISGFDYKSFSSEPCMTFYGYAFTRRENSLLWKVDDTEVGSGEKADYCFPEAPKSYQITLQAIDKKSSEIIESITRKIEVKLGIIPKLLKIKEEMKEKIELISTTLGEKLTEFGRTVRDNVWIKVKHSEAKPAGIITIHFEQATEDIDLTSMVADADSEKKKSLLYMPAWPKEVESSKILFIPK